jgi:hypothetical protein
MIASKYNTYAEYCNAKTIMGYQVIPESLWNTLKQQDMLETTMIKAIANSENIDEDGAINWNYVDADCFMAVGDKFETPEAFYQSFEEMADKLDPVDLLTKYPDSINQLEVLKTDFLGISK